MEVDIDIFRDLKISFGLLPNSSTSLEINPIEKNIICSDDSRRVGNEMKTAIRNCQIDGPIKFTFTLEDCKCKLKVHGPYLDYLVRTLGKGIIMWIKSKELTCSIIKSETDISNVLNHIPGELRDGLWNRFKDDNVSNSWLYFSSQRSQLYGNYTIACSAAFSFGINGIVTGLPVGIGDNDFSLQFNKKLLSEQWQTDTEIIASDGTKIGCHKIFLTGNSAVFEKMMEGESFLEGQTRSINLNDMSELGVKSLLDFLYCGDVKAALEDFDICLELLEASEKYGIIKLQEKMKFIIFLKPFQWFNVDSTLRLFCFSRNLQNCLDIKQLSARVLKSKYAQIEESETFKQVFKENSEIALDLCCSIAAIRSE